MSTRTRQYKLNKEENQRLRSKKMNKNQDIKDFFFSMSQNIFTPDFLSCGSRNNYNLIYEVTTGTGMNEETTYGLTVYEWKTESGISEYVRTDHGGLYYCKKELDSSIKNL